MTVTAVRKDLDALTLILTAEFEASPERVWDLWADPRQLERWWGPHIIDNPEVRKVYLGEHFRM